MIIRLCLAGLLLFLGSGCSSDGTTGAMDIAEMIDETEIPTLRQGPFEATAGIGKEATGSATLETQSDSSLRLAFSEDFSVTDGPGLYVFLSNAQFPTDDAVELRAFIRPSGAQVYAVPDSIEIDEYSHVLVHCIPYGVTFAFAEFR